jgi:hypothetical protein
MSNLYRGPSKDASYQVLIHLAKRSQRGRFFRNQPIRNKNGLWRPCLLTDREKMTNLYRGPSIDASYQISVHLGKWFQRRFFRNQPIKNKNGLWQTCLLTDRNKWVISIEDLPRMLPTKFWFIWPGGFRGEIFFRNQPIRNKNGLWLRCLLTDRDEMSNLYRGPSIDASYQVSVQLVKWFQRRRLLEIHHSETRIACGGHVC